MAKSLASEENIIESLGQIAKEKNLGADLVLDTLRTSLITAARKYENLEKNIEVDIDQEHGIIRCFLRVEVVDDFPDYPEGMTDEAEMTAFDEKYMLLSDAQKYQSDIQVGDTLEVEIPIARFGRAAIALAKQTLVKKVRDVEHERVYNDYHDRIGTIVTGTVQQVDRGNILVNLGRTEAIIPSREQIRKERFRQGDSIRAYICDVTSTPKGTQIILSRTHTEFLAKLFELEVPEIYDEIVQIRAVARDPGFRAKIAVFSKDERVDPVGACVGMKGNRVQAIVRELSNERIDIIHWSDDLPTYVKRLFAPAEVHKVFMTENGHVCVVVADEDLSLAIGRNGQNVRLSSTILGKEIDVRCESDYNEMMNGEDPEAEGAAAEPVEETPEAPASAPEE